MAVAAIAEGGASGHAQKAPRLAEPRRRRYRAAMRTACFALLLALAGCHKAAPDNTQAGVEAPAPAGKVDRSHAGKPAPQTGFLDPDGQNVNLAELEGKPLLVNLWATWCAPCVQEMPTLDKLAAAEGGKLQVLALSQDTGGPEKVDAFFAKQQFTTIEAYRDPKMQLMTDLGVEVLPTTILFDAEGREQWRVTGQLDWQGAEAATLLKQAFRRR
jgi:thiol-disulfide isomerase/thioredoxin